MTDARTQIADIIIDYASPMQGGDVSGAADAILAALPAILRADPSVLRGMVKPLIWRNSYGVWRAGTVWGDYKVSGKILTLPLPLNPQQVHDDEQAAQSAADLHNVAATLAELGVTA